MKAVIVSDYDTKKLLKVLKENSVSISNDPDFVFTYGGDGTILKAENKFPGIPIIPVQNSHVCHKCQSYFTHNLHDVIKFIKSGKYKIVEETKVDAILKNRRISALNEIQVHSSDPRKAIRFSFKTQDRNYREVIGDGIVVATPYGSTGYFRSIGYKPFKSGLMAGFNNTWPHLPAVPLARCKIKITREGGYVAADNFFLANIREGDTITIQKSKKKARFVITSRIKRF